MSASTSKEKTLIARTSRELDPRAPFARLRLRRDERAERAHERGHVEAHEARARAARDALEPARAEIAELDEAVRLLHRDLQARGGALDQALEEERLVRVVLRLVPQALPRLVRLPQVAVVVEVDAVQVLLVLAPARGREVARARFGDAEGVPAR